jgi:osmoprotectant transport system ATP-binding protein
VGGVLEQFDTPDALLAAPANDFVAEFLGAERSIKRLSLSSVRDLDLDTRTWVDVSAGLEGVRVAMAGTPHGWLGVVEDGRFAGWVSAEGLERASSLDDLEPVPPLARVGPDSTLREALEVILNSRSAAAVVEDDDGRFSGLVELEAIRRGLAG